MTMETVYKISTAIMWGCIMINCFSAWRCWRAVKRNDEAVRAWLESKRMMEEAAAEYAAELERIRAREGTR